MSNATFLDRSFLSQSFYNLGFIVFLFFALAGAAHAEQKHSFNGFELHYIVIPTTMLTPEIARSYDLPRGKDRALLNVSVLNRDGKAVEAELAGTSTNLLSQQQRLGFTRVQEGEAIYYLATIRHSPEEVHRINIDANVVGIASTNLKFNQKLYWSE